MLTHLPICMVLFVLLLGLSTDALQAVESKDTGNATAEANGGPAEAPVNVPLAGHSEHGAAYNEGPRQNAYLMGGTGAVDLPVTTTSDQAQAFFHQGLGQLYGFWYYEAERSFRRVATLDPDCAMGYWGLAQANLDNQERARSFIAEAYTKRENASRHDRLYIEALHTYLTSDGKAKKRRGQYVKDLEKIIREFPEDIEAKAQLAVFLWQSQRYGLPIVSHQAVDSMLGDVFRRQPMHPAHHFRIHLWDHEEPAQALRSAALCGQAAPSIAHMWHMPGHIYSRLKRYDDAVYQQEASARADHAHMMRDGVLPDQIGNYAHNNEWLIRNLIHLGRARDALDLAKNMLELPRHPKYNTFDKDGMCSCKYGRRRLLQVLETFELWDDIVRFGSTMYLEPTDQQKEQIERRRMLGLAHYHRGESQLLKECIEGLEAQLAGIDNDIAAAADKAEQEVRDEFAQRESRPGSKADSDRPASSGERHQPDAPISMWRYAVKASAFQPNTRATGAETAPERVALEDAVEKARKEAIDEAGRVEDEAQRALAELRAVQCLHNGATRRALEHLDESDDIAQPRLAYYHYLAGDEERARDLAAEAVQEGENEVRPLAVQVDLLRRMGQRDEATAAMKTLRTVAAFADLDTPPLSRLAGFAKELGFPEDWRIRPAPKQNLGTRPDLQTLGPFRWSPTPAKPWSLPDGRLRDVSLADYEGQPVIVIFYLGAGCLHCVEQLHKFAPMINEFRELGVSMVAISTESPFQLSTSLDDYAKDGQFPIRLVSDEPLRIFRAYRAYDDFEQMPLHGTFLIDAHGLVRWHDISYEPFVDAEFLLAECRRLLFPHDTAAE